MKSKATFSLPEVKNGSSLQVNEETEKKRTYAQRARKLIQKRIPITKWIRTYQVGDLIADAVAGVTVGLTVVPQSLAYAAIAGCQEQYGLYSSYLACLIYIVLGSCRQATIGPTAVMGLLTFQTCGNNFPECAVLTAFYSGVFELCMAVLQLGWIVSFISEPVTIGFTAGASATIISSQIKNFFGIKGDKGSGFLGYWTAVFRDISSISLGDSAMGIGCFIALMLLRKVTTLGISKRSKVIKKALWLISVSRNVIIVITTTAITSFLGKPSYKIVGTVQGGFPTLEPPHFLLPIRHNSTIDGQDTEHEGDTMSFIETWQFLKTGPMVIALIAVLQNVAISKTFGAGQSVDATQEMFALGTCNIIGGFFSAIPTSGSFSRSAVNEASGVRSPLGGLYTGVLVLFALNFLSPSFYYIPKAALAAVIISAVMLMIEFETLRPMWRISRLDLVTCLVTFITCILIGMEFGILIGVGLSSGAILMKLLNPKINEKLELEETTGTKYFLITPQGSGLIFPSVDSIRTRVNKLALKHKAIKLFILSFEHWAQVDYTAATALVSLVKGLEKNKKSIQFINCSQKWIQVLETAGLKKVPALEAGDIEDFIKKSATLNVIVDLHNAEVLITAPITEIGDNPIVMLTSTGNKGNPDSNASKSMMVPS